jgi:ferredoxin
MGMRLSADRDDCIASGNCVMISAALFDQDDDGVVVLLTEDVPESEQERAREAVRTCPASVLHLS